MLPAWVVMIRSVLSFIEVCSLYCLFCWSEGQFLCYGNPYVGAKEYDANDFTGGK